MTPYTRQHAERDAEILAILGLNNYDLAEEVLDLKAREACEINNNGLSAQLTSLYEGTDVEYATAMLVELLAWYGVDDQRVRRLLFRASE